MQMMVDTTANCVRIYWYTCFDLLNMLSSG